MIGKRIIVATAVLVNAATFASAAIRVPKNDIRQLISWLETSGKDREDYNQENAQLIGLKAGEARSKGRGAKGKDGAPHRSIHLFSKRSKPDFVVLDTGNEDAYGASYTTYKILPNGKIVSAFTLSSRMSNGKIIDDSVKQTDHKLDKYALEKVNEEIAFWLPRAQKDLPPPTEPAAKK